MKTLKHQAYYQIITLYNLNRWNNTRNVPWGGANMHIQNNINYYLWLINEDYNEIAAKRKLQTANIS